MCYFDWRHEYFLQYKYGSMAVPADTSSIMLLLEPSTPDAEKILSGAVHLHAQCVVHDGTLLTYLPPLSYSKLMAYWRAGLEQVPQGLRHIIINLQPVSSRTSSVSYPPLFGADADPSPPTPIVSVSGTDYEVAGAVSLSKSIAETGPMRGVVQKLVTSPNHRRKGVARSVMRELERLAREDGRWSLLLDTTVGTEAEQMYPRLGYIRMGVVEAYGINPKTGELVDEVWFWKDLRKSTPI